MVLKRIGLTVLGVFALVMVVLAVVQGLVRVTWNGVVVTERARVIDGTLYVPAADLAKAYGATVKYEKGASMAEIVGGGGAGQRAGNVMVAGEWALIDGFRFWFDKTPVYRAEDKQWVVKGKVRNAQEEARYIWLEYGAKKHVLQNVESGDSLRDSLNYMINGTSGVMLQKGEEADIEMLFEGSADFGKDLSQLKLVATFKTGTASFDAETPIVVRCFWGEPKN